MAKGEATRRVPRPTRPDLALAALILVLGVTEELVAPNAHATSAWWLLGVLGATVAVLLRSVTTVAALCILVGVLVVWRNTSDQGDVVTGWQFWALMVLVFSVGVQMPWRTGALAVLGSGVVVLSVARGDGALTDQASLAIPTAAAWAVGFLVQRSLRRVQDLEGLARDTAAAAGAAVAEERARLARELHDVVAHQVSVMVLLSGVARRRLNPDQVEEGDLLRQAESAGRHAVEELQRMLGLLRTDASQAPPRQPSLKELPDLVAPVLLGGRDVHLDLPASLPEMSPALELSAYRIVQEGLTNSLKHAPSGRTHIAVRHDGHDLHVSVRTDGGPVPPPLGRASGRGLLGIAERVKLFGGSLQSGPLPTGGFAVDVVLPAPPA